MARTLLPISVMPTKLKVDAILERARKDAQVRALERRGATLVEFDSALLDRIYDNFKFADLIRRDTSRDTSPDESGVQGPPSSRTLALIAGEPETLRKLA